MLGTGSLRCDRCGKFRTRLHGVPANPPEKGIERSVCDSCAKILGLLIGGE